MKRVLLVLTVAVMMAVMLVVMAAPALADPGGNFNGKGKASGGGDRYNVKDEEKAQKIRTGGGYFNNNPHFLGI